MAYPFLQPRSVELAGTDEVVVAYDDDVTLNPDLVNRIYLWNNELAVPVDSAYQDDPTEIRIVFMPANGPVAQAGFASTPLKPVALDPYNGAVGAFVEPVHT